MITTAPSQDTVVAERLLTELLNRMDGLLDTGTSVLLAGILPDARAFIDDRMAVLRSLAVVLRALMPAPTDEARGGSLARLPDACEHFGDVLTQLTVPPSPEIDRSVFVNELRGVVSEITTAITATAIERGIVLPPSEERAAHRERIFQNLEAYLARNGRTAPQTNAHG
jgi:hypothetical protein